MSRRAGRRGPTALAALLGLGLALVAAPAGAAPVGAAAPTGTPSAPASAAAAASSSASTSSVVGGTTTPLVVVVDLSSSMADDDGNGTVKLEGAKTALMDVVRRQPAGATVGLWTYPGDGDCSAGGYVAGAQPQQLADPETLTATIRTLEANGNTPTGDALLAVRDDLRARGLAGATILLVSDGESNCGEPPCDVAKEIVDSGFDLTVQSLGFQVSDEGKDELQCISDATGGAYYDVADSAQLAEALAALGVPGLELTATTSASSVPPGGRVTVDVDVTNPSTRDASDVSVALTFDATGADAVAPAVVPPRYRLGNVPAGATVHRTWSVSTPLGTTGTASWRVTAWSTDAGAARQDGTIVVSDTALGLADAGPLVTQSLAHGPLVVLGDSFSSGEGAGDYRDYPTDGEDKCDRSDRTTAVSLAGADASTIVACSGAVSGDLLGPNSNGVRSQLVALRDLDTAPGLVVMTIGGNDIGFSNIIMKCTGMSVAVEAAGAVSAAHGGDVVGAAKKAAQAAHDAGAADCTTDTAFVDAVFARISALQDQLVVDYQAVDAVVNAPDVVADRDGHRAPILVMAYPQLLADWQRASCTLFGRNEVAFGNDVVDALDDAVGAAAADAAAGGADVHAVPTSQQAMLPSHTACDHQPFANWGSAASVFKTYLTHREGLLHPNADGYRAITQSLVAWSQGAGTDETGGPAAAAPTLVTSQDVAAHVDLSDGTSSTLDVAAGQSISVDLHGLAPGSVVTIVVHSRPTALASLEVADDGTAHGVVTLPADLPPGQHVLVADGLDPDLGAVETTRPLAVSPARPRWLVPAGSTGAALALGGLVLLGVARRDRRRGDGRATDPEDGTTEGSP